MWTPPGRGSPVTVSSSTIFDAQGRVTMSIDPLGNTNRTFYNSLGKVDYTVDKFGNTNSFLYDTRGNLIRTTDALGLVSYIVYDDAGRAFFTMDRNGITGTHTERGQSRVFTLTRRFGRFGHARALRIEYPGAIYHVLNSESLREQVVVAA